MCVRWCRCSPNRSGKAAKASLSGAKTVKKVTFPLKVRLAAAKCSEALDSRLELYPEVSLILILHACACARDTKRAFEIQE